MQIFYPIRGIPSYAPVGYNNLTNWPAINGLAGFTKSNRPLVSGSTINWIGPTLSDLGGAVLSTANDIPQSISLTASGVVTTSANGQVIDKLLVTGTTGSAGIIVQHNNVTIQRCFVNGGNTNGNASAIGVASGVTGLVIQDCQLFGSGSDAGACYTVGNSAGVANAVGAFNMYRCNLYGGIKQIGQVESNVGVYDTLFHGGVGNDNDHFAMWGGSTNVNVQHCYFTDVDNSATAKPSDSAINCGTYLGNVPGPITVNNCGFYMPNYNSGHTVLFQASYTPGGTIGGITITNNGIVSPYTWNWYGFTGSTILANANNFNMATSTDTNGTLVNGTGAL
jgi:hypothetical protein